MPSPWHQHPTAYPDLFRHKREEQVVASELYGDFFYDQLDHDAQSAERRDTPGNPVALADRSFDDGTHDGIHYHATALEREALTRPRWRVTITSSGEWGDWHVTLCRFKRRWWESVTIEEISGDREGFQRFLFAARILSKDWPIKIWEGDLPQLDDTSFYNAPDLPDDAVRYPALFDDYKSERVAVNRLRLAIQENWMMLYSVRSEKMLDDVWLVDVGYFNELWRLGPRSQYFAYLFESSGGKWGEWSCFLCRHQHQGRFVWIRGDTDKMRAYFANRDYLLFREQDGP